VTGVVGGDLPTSAALILGVANLVADGFAMAASNYSGSKAERDDYQRVLEIERRHIAVVPGANVRQIFALKGLVGADLERMVAVLESNPDQWSKTMVVEEYGLSPTHRSPGLAALSTLAAFMLCGLVSLLTYLSAGGLLACVVATSATFIAVGAIKSRWSQKLGGDQGSKHFSSE